MRYIEKQALPVELAGKLEKALADNLSWSDFSTNEAETKQALRRHLEAEQAGLCAYSEISLSEYDFHIEHIKPKGLPPYSNLRFDHQNLLASAPDNQGNVDRRDLFGGHKKGSDYGDDWFISPTDRECENYFQYAPNGDIQPKQGLSENEAIRASKTIECLGLQSSRLLVNKRRSLYQRFNSQLGFLLDQPEALKFYKDDYLTADEEGKLKPFQSVVKQIFNVD